MNFKNVMRFAMVMVAGGFMVSSVFAVMQSATRRINVKLVDAEAPTATRTIKIKLVDPEAPTAAHGTKLPNGLRVVVLVQQAPAQGGMVMVNVAPNKVDRVVSIATDDCQYHKAGRLFFYLECEKCPFVDLIPLACLRDNKKPIHQQCSNCSSKYKITLMHYQIQATTGKLTGKEVYGLEGTFRHMIGRGAYDSVQDIVFFRANFGFKITAKHFMYAATLSPARREHFFLALCAAYTEDNPTGERIEFLMQQCHNVKNLYKEAWSERLKNLALSESSRHQ